MSKREREKRPYRCAKCGNSVCDTGEIRASGGGLSSIFDIETERFSYVACARCRYTEFYQVSHSGLANVVDFMIG